MTNLAPLVPLAATPNSKGAVHNLETAAEEVVSDSFEDVLEGLIPVSKDADKAVETADLIDSIDADVDADAITKGQVVEVEETADAAVAQQLADRPGADITKASTNLQSRVLPLIQGKQTEPSNEPGVAFKSAVEINKPTSQMIDPKGIATQQPQLTAEKVGRPDQEHLIAPKPEVALKPDAMTKQFPPQPTAAITSMPEATRLLDNETLRAEGRIAVEIAKSEQAQRFTPNITTATPTQHQAKPTSKPSIEISRPNFLTPQPSGAEFTLASLDESAQIQTSTRSDPSTPIRFEAPLQAARQVSQQVAYAISQNGPGTTEIRLSPEELGRVRMTVQAVEGVVTITVVAERQEVGDLMRRHSDGLAEQLKDMGYDTINLAFGDEQQATNSDAEQDEGQATIAATEAPIEDMALPRSTLSQSDTLDIRL